MSTSKKKDAKFNTPLVVVAVFFVLLVSFLAYMINTTLEDVLEEEYGAPVVTHNYEDDEK